MLKESLPPGTYEGFDLASGRKPVKVTPETKLGGFDFVALDVYMDLQRKIGTRIGKRVGDAIHWEDGEVFPIPEAKFRYKKPNGEIRTKYDEVPDPIV